MRIMNKKAVSNSLLHVLSQIFIIALVIVIFFFLAVKLWEAMFGSDKNTILFFNAMADNVQLMIDRPTDFEHQSMISYFHENYNAFGFTDSQTVAFLTGGSTSYDLSRGYGVSYRVSNTPSTSLPAKCEGKPCLCLYDGTGDFPEKPVVCRSFNANIIFHGYYGPKIGTTLAGVVVPQQEASLYSDYPENMRLAYSYMGLPTAGSSVSDLYLEKFKSGDRIHILITPYLSSNQIKRRVNSYSPCPESSDAQCIGSNYDANVGSGYCYFSEDQQKCLFMPEVNACAINQRLNGKCFCGSEFIDTSQDKWRAGAYCYELNDQPVAFQFDCNFINQCEDYCASLTKVTMGCDGDEIDYCTTDPCAKGLFCKIVPSDDGNQRACSPASIVSY